ncbi:MAG TPA: tripartite tricarboxylate transporter TctB family protein [Burkholderiales bacterium]|nr:tripartite tricarboxylate transporter TctB family protein [Burkholderiales bacterium]
MKADHVAGAVFIALGVVVLAISSELPFGSLSAPGAGMMPKVVTGFMIVFGAMVMLGAARSAPLASIDWSDRNHAALVVLITGAAVAAYRPLGFLVTMSLLVFLLLVVVERRNALAAAAYAIGLTLFAYWLFGKALRSPLEQGILWF